MKTLTLLLSGLFPVIGLYAQKTGVADTVFCAGTGSMSFSYAAQQKPDKQVLNHLSLSVTMGSTGVGLDVAMPVTKWARLRTGFTYMPRFNHTMHFGVQVGDKQESAEEQKNKFDHLSGMLESFVGNKVDDRKDMVGTPCFDNFKLMADLFPFKDKRWHITAGFYYGSAKVAKADNATEDATSLVAVAMYNNFYSRVCRSYESVLASMNDPNVVPEPYMSFGGNDYYADEELYNKFTSYGRMGVHIANYKDGVPYRLEPDENNMVKVAVRTNRFRPYLGFGYGGPLSKKDDTYSLSFDCGVMFWGGTPKIVTHDGTNLSDLDNVRGKVGDYVRLIKAFPVYPVVSISLTRRLF